MRKNVGGLTLVLVALFAVAVSGVSAQTAPPAGQAQQEKAKDQDKEKTAAADPVSGDWEGLVELPDQTMPFSMKLKLDKDKITGEVASVQGSTTISEGTWVEKEARITLAFTYVDGAAIAMTGTLKDDQLVGTMNYGGQTVMNWVAKKKAK